MKIPEPPKLPPRIKQTSNTNVSDIETSNVSNFTSKDPSGTLSEASFRDVWVSTNDDDAEQSEKMFENVQRDLVVNANPFLRWLKNVGLALLITTAVLVAVGYFTDAPIIITAAAIGSVWIIILAITAPEAIIPYKKTRFLMEDKTIQVGRRKPQPMSSFDKALLNTKKKSISIWLENSNDSRNGFNVPLKSSKFSMTSYDLMALRTILPYLAIKSSPDVNETGLVLTDINKDVQISSRKIEEIIDELLLDM